MKKLLIGFAVVGLFAFTGCKKEDPVDVVVQKTPVSMVINKVLVKSFPPTNNGSAWDDDGTGVDLALYVYHGYDEVVTASTYFADCVNGNSYEFTDDFPFTIFSVDDDYSIDFLDYDMGVTPPDFMGSYSFIPEDIYKDGKTVYNARFDGFEIDIYVSWTF